MLPVALDGVTLAVRVTDWPGDGEVGEAESTVAVVSLPMDSGKPFEVLVPFLESPL
jgi:hypothetical protein